MYKKKGYSKYWLGKKLSPEHKEKIKKNNPKYWQGKHLSEEHRRKLSLLKIGKTHTKEAREKMSLSQKGRKHSKETKDKIGKAHKGVRRPQQSLRQKGANSHLWKGGITPVNLLIRSSAEYKLWREAVFKRDDYMCIWCGLRSRRGIKVYLHADHIKPFAHFPALRFAIDNGRTLCKDCHKKTDTYGNKGRYYLMKKHG